MKNEKLVVLIVEDSLLIIERIFSLLENLENVKLVLHAANYSESKRIMDEISADVVLLDINLPDGNGIELLREIKAIHSCTKVIMFTNHATDNYRKICCELGAEYFLDKSIEFDKIHEVISGLKMAS